MANEVMAPQVLTKQPYESRFFNMDFSNLMEDSETISSIVSITSELIGGGDSDLILADETIDGQTVSFTISGGTNAKRYKIEIRIITSTTNHLEGDGILKVRD